MGTDSVSEDGSLSVEVEEFDKAGSLADSAIESGSESIDESMAEEDESLSGSFDELGVEALESIFDSGEASVSDSSGSRTTSDGKEDSFPDGSLELLSSAGKEEIDEKQHSKKIKLSIRRNRFTIKVTPFLILIDFDNTTVLYHFLS